MKRFQKIVGVYGAAIAIMAGMLLLLAPQAHATQCDDGSRWYGEGCFQGYFNPGHNQTSGGDVIPGGISVSSKANFISQIEGYRTSGNAHLETAANFIILTMLGLNAGRANSVSPAQLTDWKNRVNSPGVTMLVRSVFFSCGIFNTYYQSADDIAAGYSTAREGCGSNNTMIDFIVGGVTVYRIRAACGNPLGSPAGLPVANTRPSGNITLSCAPDGGGIVVARWSDPDGVTNAYIRYNGGGVTGRVTGTSHTWNLPVTQTRGTWTVSLYVADRGGSGDVLVDSASHAICSRPPVGGMVSATCTTVSGWIYDPDNTARAVQYYVYVNGTRRGPGTADLPTPTAPVAGNHGFSNDPNSWVQFNPRTTNTIQVTMIDTTGAQTALPARTIGPCIAPSCVSTTYPTSAELNAPVSFTVTSDMGVPWGPPWAAPNNPKFTVTVTGPAGFPTKTWTGATAPYTAPAAGAEAILTTLPLTFTPSVKGNYYLHWTTTATGTPADADCGDTNAVPGSPGDTCLPGSCPFVLTTILKPYFSVLGGDISAGLTYKDGATCTQLTGGAATNAIIRSQNYDSGNDYGAGTQLGAFALGQISSFITNLNPLALPTSARAYTLTHPYDVSFANNSPAGGAVVGPAGSGQYGGGFGAFGYCSADFSADANNRPGAITSGGGAVNITGMTGTHIYNGSITITGVLAPGQRLTLVVNNADAFIASNIVYPAGVTSVDDIPYFEVLTKGGDIGVAAVDGVGVPVDTLYGFYSAQQDGGGGTFASCATGPGAEASDYTLCAARPLTIYGAVAADTIHFTRSYGTLHGPAGATQLSGTPAERIQFSPALWLGAAGECRSDPTLCTSSNSQYQSITSLPPTL